MTNLSTTLIPFGAFVVFASPEAFKMVRGVAGSWVASADGAATLMGLLLHALIYVMLVGFIMRRLPRLSFDDLKTKAILN